MLITFQELRNIKHSLPTGGVKAIARILNIEAQTVRNYFSGQHRQAGPGGGVVHLADSTILNLAKQLSQGRAVGSR